MFTEKKNQHYIPKFYLRNFSYMNNKKQIGVFNIFNQLFIQTAKLKTQGSKNFFYGYDSKIEDGLADIEGTLAEVINGLINKNSFPIRFSQGHNNLLIFVTLTDLRNPVKIQNTKKMIEQGKEKLLEMDPNTDVNKLIPIANHEDIIKLSLSKTIKMSDIMLDLDYKLLLNQTNRPFITSDYPIVKYNQFLEQKKWSHSKTGYGLVGLQIFIPLNSQKTLLFFDPRIYKVGDKKKKILNISNETDVDQLNILQYINCFKTIFFDENASELYINKLFTKSKNYKRANIFKATLSYLFKEGDDQKRIIESGQKNLIAFGSSDCAIKLSINGIKIHSKGKKHKLNLKVAQLRPHAERLIKLEENK